MRNLSKASVVSTTAALGLATGAALLIAGAVGLVGSTPAQATPAYAQQTGKACGYCHQNTAGGGALTAAGKKFQANGHKL